LFADSLTEVKLQKIPLWGYSAAKGSQHQARLVQILIGEGFALAPVHIILHNANMKIFFKGLKGACSSLWKTAEHSPAIWKSRPVLMACTTPGEMEG